MRVARSPGGTSNAPPHPPGKEDLWRRQGEADAVVTRIEKAITAADRKARELAAAFDPDDSIVEDADAEVERLYAEHDRATAVANRVYDERMAGLSSWIDTDPTAPVCTTCNGAGHRPGTRGGDVVDACAGCRGWGRAPTEPIPVWSEQDQQWVNPATGRTVDLLADPEPAEAEVKPEKSAMRGLWAAVRHPIDTIDRKITEAQTCPGCGCKPHEWRADCGCLRQGCVCAGAEQDDNPGWEREPGPDAAIVDAAGRNDGLPPAAKPYEPQRKRPQKTTPPTGGTSTGSTGGAGMSIEAARAQIMGGHETGQAALGAINQAHEMVGDARNDLWQATEGSNQAEAEPARAQLTEAMTKLEEAAQQVASALQEFESVANRL